MKTCTKCKESKDEAMFYKQKAGKDGLQSICKECDNYRSSRYKMSHRDIVDKSTQDWMIKHPDCIRAIRHKYHHKRRTELSSSPFPKEFKLMSHCWICLSTDRLEVDHIIPVSRGGSNDISNLTTLCKSCNCSKGSKTYSEWFEKRLGRARRN